MTKGNEIPGLDNARGWYASIVEMVDALNKADDPDQSWEFHEPHDSAEETIHESVLSVEVRSGWHDPGEINGTKNAEYRILLTTGGPGLQLTGTLSEHGEPETAELQSQDWFKPWTEVHERYLMTPQEWANEAMTGASKVRETLLTFARCFYFRE